MKVPHLTLRHKTFNPIQWLFQWELWQAAPSLNIWLWSRPLRKKQTFLISIVLHFFYCAWYTPSATHLITVDVSIIITQSLNSQQTIRRNPQECQLLEPKKVPLPSSICVSDKIKHVLGGHNLYLKFIGHKFYTLSSVYLSRGVLLSLQKQLYVMSSVAMERAFVSL